LELAGIELEIAARMAREKILSDLITSTGGGYDIVLIDCPPSLGLITVNALVASNRVLIPMEAEFLAYRGINSLVDIINKVRSAFNPKLEIMGVFFTMFQQNRVLSNEIKQQVSDIFGSSLMESPIRVNVALAECQSNGQDIFNYDQNSNGAKDYLKLTNELIEKTWAKSSAI
jgi:chromosome partitioning protein